MAEPSHEAEPTQPAPQDAARAEIDRTRDRVKTAVAQLRAELKEGEEPGMCLVIYELQYASMRLHEMGFLSEGDAVLRIAEATLSTLENFKKCSRN
jgi:hypothetical protein